MPSESKVFEKLIAVQVTSFLLDNHLLTAIQFGFWKDYRGQTVLIKLTNFLFTARHNKLFNIITMIDFRRAFDSLPHEMLLKH